MPDRNALAASLTTAPPSPAHQTLAGRGGGGVYTGSLATGPPSPIYAKHTTINGSRPGFIVVCIIAGLIFFSILGGGYWWYRRRRTRSTSSVSKRYSIPNGAGIGRRLSGMFGGGGGGGRKSTSDRERNAGRWTTLDDEDDAFTTNVSMVDLNDPHEASAQDYPKRWNPVYAASGESINFTDERK